MKGGTLKSQESLPVIEAEDTSMTKQAEILTIITHEESEHERCIAVQTSSKTLAELPASSMSSRPDPG